MVLSIGIENLEGELDVFADKLLQKPGAVAILGTPIDLSRVDCDKSSWPALPITSRHGKASTGSRACSVATPNSS